MLPVAPGKIASSSRSQRSPRLSALAKSLVETRTPACLSIKATRGAGVGNSIKESKINLQLIVCTVELDFKNRQDKNQLGFKNQIINDRLDQISSKNCQDKNNLTLRTKIVVTKNVLKVKFDCQKI